MSSTAEDMYHVAQHSRREKLRYPVDESAVTGTSSLPLLYQSINSLYMAPSSSTYYSHDVEGCGSHQIQPQPQGFSLSLSPAAVGPLGPFTGYAAVLNRSGFVEPARQLLEEICRLGGGDHFDRDLMEDIISTSYSMETHEGERSAVEEDHWKKAKLLSMLDEVYRRYRLYYQQVETVITSFETVAGLNTAAPYVSLALKSMSKSFRSLKNLISNHLNNLGKVNGKEGLGKGEFTGFGISTTTGENAYCSQRRNSSLTFGQPQVWRPQRGLPERAVSVLRAWLFEHFLHPYPTDTDKQILAKQTGLTRNQVSNWFINARVRLWKPMVEEIHNLEMHQIQKSVVLEEKSCSSSAATSSSNRGRQPYSNNNNDEMEVVPFPPEMEQPYKFMEEQQNPKNIGAAGNSSFCLTLGLPEPPLSINVARRFGLEECSNAYVLTGGFQGPTQQDTHYANQIAPHMLHHFVG